MPKVEHWEKKYLSLEATKSAFGSLQLWSPVRSGQSRIYLTQQSKRDISQSVGFSSCIHLGKSPDETFGKKKISFIANRSDHYRPLQPGRSSLRLPIGVKGDGRCASLSHCEHEALWCRTKIVAMPVRSERNIFSPLRKVFSVILCSFNAKLPSSSDKTPAIVVLVKSYEHQQGLHPLHPLLLWFLRAAHSSRFLPFSLLTGNWLLVEYEPKNALDWSLSRWMFEIVVLKSKRHSCLTSLVIILLTQKFKVVWNMSEK